MPVNKSRYPDNWKEISHHVRFERANGYCEWCGVKHGTYGARDRDGKFIPQDVIDEVYGMQSDAGYAYLKSFGWNDYPDLIKIVLTTAHIGIPKYPGDTGDKSDKMDCRLNNLVALCQRCHLRFDIEEHIANRRETLYQKRLATRKLEGYKVLPGFDDIVGAD